MTYEEFMQILSITVEVNVWIYLGATLCLTLFVVWIANKYFKLSKEKIDKTVEEINVQSAMLDVYTRIWSVYFEWQQDMLTDEQAMRRIAEVYVNGNRKYLRGKSDAFQQIAANSK